MNKLVFALIFGLVGCSTAQICSVEQLPPAGQARPTAYRLPTDVDHIDGTGESHSWPADTMEWHGGDFDHDSCGFTEAAISSESAGLGCSGRIYLNGLPGNGLDGHVRPVFVGSCYKNTGETISPVYSLYE